MVRMLEPRINWLRHGALERPAQQDALAQCPEREANLSRPFTKILSAALIRIQRVRSDRRRQNVLYGPAAIKASLERSGPHATQPLPFRNSHSSAIPFKEPTVSLVVRLLLRGGPTTVARLIRAFVVDSVERVARRRTSADIAQKGPKVSTPLIAYRDSTTSVARPVLVAGAIAALKHVSPSDSFWAGLYGHGTIVPYGLDQIKGNLQ